MEGLAGALFEGRYYRTEDVLKKVINEDI